MDVKKEGSGNKRIALITGASSGLGQEFVSQLGEKEQLGEIWAVARRADRLAALQQVTPIPVRPVPMDLTRRESIEELEALLAEEQPHVALLINAAGFGKIGNYEEIAREEEERMIELNCRAAVSVTRLCIPYMREKDRIMEICSTSAFQPFQHLNVYAASKAFLYRYSRALRVELMPKKIRVTAVCPYWIKDTEFIPTAKGPAGNGRIRNFPLASKKKSVVKWALRDSRAGFAVSAPGPVCIVHRIVCKIIPAEAMMGLWALLRRI